MPVSPPQTQGMHKPLGQHVGQKAAGFVLRVNDDEREIQGDVTALLDQPPSAGVTGS